MVSSIVVALLVLVNVAFAGDVVDEGMCVPKGLEWIVTSDIDARPDGMIRDVRTDEPLISVVGAHDGKAVQIVATLSGEAVFVDPDVKNADAPGYERGEGCTWRRVHYANGVFGEFEQGVLAKPLAGL